MNLATKIILAILCILILFMGGFTYLIAGWQRATFEKSAHRCTKVLGESLSDSIETEMELGRSDLVQQTLERIGKGSSQIRTLRIIDPQGKILRSVDPGEIGKGMDFSPFKARLQEVSTLLEHQGTGTPVLSFIKPIPNKSQCQKCHAPAEEIIGFLVMGVTTAPVEEMVSSSQRLILVGMGIALLLVVGAILLITSRWVRAPLSKVINAMEGVEKGNLNVRVDLASRDELGKVARTFNSMVENLRKNKEDLEILHRKEMERTRKMATLGELAQAIAHEIRNPLAGISATVEIIREGFDKSDHRAQIFDEIRLQANRIQKIVSNLLQFAAKSSPQFVFFDLHEMIDGMIRQFSSQIESQGIHIEKQLQPDFPKIYADPYQIQQMLTNIVLNATQAMPGGGKLGFRTSFRPADEEIGLVIADTGKGIPEETIPQLFKPFYTTKAKGAGLGLAVVQKIVQEHGGRVAVSSTVGAGTTVEISLPVRPRPFKAKENGSV